jgi:hypothetical protein
VLQRRACRSSYCQYISAQFGIERKNRQRAANSDKTFGLPVPNLDIIE